MKKLLIGGIIVVVVLLIGYNVISNHTAHQKKAGEAKHEKALAVLKDNSCISCHSQSAEEPFYAFVPGIGTMIKQDMLKGTRSLDLDNTFDKMEQGEPISEVVLTKIEYAIQNNTMPVAQYKALHWGSAIKSKEKQVILDWAADSRATDYGENLAAQGLQNEPIRPISKEFAVDSAKVALGYDLYFDTRISANNTISCATCHDLDKGGTDQLPVSLGIHDQKGPINSPTVYNSAYFVAQFWDGRAIDLQEQAAGPPMDPKEMGNTSFDDIVNRLSEDEKLKARFEELYAEGVTKNSITHAIAEFEKTLNTPNSPFDKYLMGDENAITENQKRGYEAFKRVGCATCHASEAMGGQSFEYVGLYANYYEDRGTEVTPADHGRAKFTNNEKDMYYQKVPTLRNIALTPPFFHDASSETLIEAVEMMNHYQVREKLSPDEIISVGDFLSTLNGEYKGKPL